MRVSNIERDKYMARMIELANEVANNYTDEKYEELWDMSADWNSEHDERDEIVMCEHEDENGETDGFYIEDDYWIIAE